MMRDLPQAVQDALDAPGPIEARLLVWIVARNRATGDPEALGLWNGDDSRAFTVGAVERIYIGAGRFLSSDAFVVAAGLAVRTHRLAIAGISETAEALVYQFEGRGAAVEIHEVVLDPDTGAVIGAPVPMFTGSLGGIEAPQGPGPATVTLTLFSEARVLTQTLPLRRSDAALRQRSATDDFRKYGALSGAIPVIWGGRRVQTQPATAPSSGEGPWWGVDPNDLGP